VKTWASLESPAKNLRRAVLDCSVRTGLPPVRAWGRDIRWVAGIPPIPIQLFGHPLFALVIADPHA